MEQIGTSLLIFNRARTRTGIRGPLERLKEVKEGKMPLESYTYIHKKSILTAEQKDALYKWCEENLATLPPAEPEQQSDKTKVENK